MKTPSIPIEILNRQHGIALVKLPYLDIPVEMSESFLRPRLKSGYYTLRHSTENKPQSKIHTDLHIDSTQRQNQSIP